MTKVQQAGMEEVRILAGLLTERFGEAGKSALLVSLKRDIVRQGLSGQAAAIYVRATRLLYEGAEPLRYTGGRK